MVRKGGNASSARRAQGQPSGAPSLPFGALSSGENGINGALKRYGIRECPQCGTQFNADTPASRPVQDSCGHFKCFNCIRSCDDCPQCNSAAISDAGISSQNGTENKRQISTRSGGNVRVYQAARKTRSSSSLQNQARVPVKPTNSLLSIESSKSVANHALDNMSNGLETIATSEIFSTHSQKLTSHDKNSTDEASGKSINSPSTSKTDALPTITLVSPVSGSSNVNVRALKSTSRATPSSSASSNLSTTSTDPVTKSPQKSAAVDKEIDTVQKTTGAGSGATADTASKSIFPVPSTATGKGCSPSPSNSVSNDGETPSSSSQSKGDSEGSAKDEKKKKKRNPVVIHDHITVIPGEPPMFQCNICMKKFKTKAHIKYHEFCQNGEKPFTCEQCGQGFIAKSHYEYHLRTHTGERPYVCPKCGKGFNQRGKVTRHMRSHTGEKPFVCTDCGRGFANAQALRSHNLIHTGERPFPCKHCNKRFTGMTNLKKHMITHTGEKPYSCQYCDKRFGLKWTLDLHIRTHSSERPYACDICSRAFSNGKDLRRHQVIHSGERPFKCWICGTAFRRKDNLDRHIKNTHNQPKEVAKQLANEAAAEYLAKVKKSAASSVPVSKVNSAVISNIITNSANGSGGSCKTDSTEEAKTVEQQPKVLESTSKSSDVSTSDTITAELTSLKQEVQEPQQSYFEFASDNYILPDMGDPIPDSGDNQGRLEVVDPHIPVEILNERKRRHLPPSDCGIHIVITPMNAPSRTEAEKAASANDTEGVRLSSEAILEDPEKPEYKDENKVKSPVSDSKSQDESLPNSVSDPLSCDTSFDVEGSVQKDDTDDSNTSVELKTFVGESLSDDENMEHSPDFGESTIKFTLTSVKKAVDEVNTERNNVDVEMQNITEENLEDTQIDDSSMCSPSSPALHDESYSEYSATEEKPKVLDSFKIPDDDQTSEDIFPGTGDLSQTDKETENTDIQLADSPSNVRLTLANAEEPTVDNEAPVTPEFNDTDITDCSTTEENSKVLDVLETDDNEKRSEDELPKTGDSQPTIDHQGDNTESQVMENVSNITEEISHDDEPSKENDVPDLPPASDVNSDEHCDEEDSLAVVHDEKGSEDLSQEAKELDQITDSPTNISEAQLSYDKPTNLQDDVPLVEESSSVIASPGIIEGDSTESLPKEEDPVISDSVDLHNTKNISEDTLVKPTDLEETMDKLHDSTESQLTETASKSEEGLTVEKPTMCRDDVLESPGIAISPESLSKEEKADTLPSPEARDEKLCEDSIHASADLQQTYLFFERETQTSICSDDSNSSIEMGDLKVLIGRPRSILSSPSPVLSPGDKLDDMQELNGTAKIPGDSSHKEDAVTVETASGSNTVTKIKESLISVSDRELVTTSESLVNDKVPDSDEELDKTLEKSKSPTPTLDTDEDMERKSMTPEGSLVMALQENDNLSPNDNPKEEFELGSSTELVPATTAALVSNTPTNLTDVHPSNGGKYIIESENRNMNMIETQANNDGGIDNSVDSSLITAPGKYLKDCGENSKFGYKRDWVGNRVGDLRFYYQDDSDKHCNPPTYHPSQIGIVAPETLPDSNLDPNNLNIIYASATAYAERNEDTSGPPVKVRLLCSAAFGAPQGTDPSNQHLFYTSTIPNQEIQNVSSPSIALAPPEVIHSVGDHSNSRISTFQYTHDKRAPVTSLSSQYPLQVSYCGKDTIQTGSSPYEHHSSVLCPLPPPMHPSRTQSSNTSTAHTMWDSSSPLPTHNHKYDINNYYCMSSEERCHATGTYDPLRALAEEAERRLKSPLDEHYDATVAAAAAIAAVGEAARRRREEERKQQEADEERQRLIEQLNFLRYERIARERAAEQERQRTTGGPRKDYLSSTTRYQD